MDIRKKKMNHRIEAWDLLKTFAIFLVIMGHFLQYMVSWSPFECPLFAWIQTFHMPLFMTLAGLFAGKDYEKNTFKDYFVKRFMRVMVPCISWLIIIFLVKGLVVDNSWSLLMLKTTLINDLWFLKSLFICCLLGYLAYKKKGNRVLYIILSLLFSQICLMWNVFIMFPCFLCGMFIYKYFNCLLNHLKLVLWISGFFFLISSLYLFFSPEYWITGKGIRQALFSGSMSIESSFLFLLDIVGRRYFNMIVGIMASVFFIVGSYVLFRNVRLCGLLKKWADSGKYTLGIYAIQTIIVEIIMVRFIQADLEHSVIYIVLFFPLLSIGVIWVAVFINSYISSKKPYLATILFGDKLQFENQRI